MLLQREANVILIVLQMQRFYRGGSRVWSMDSRPGLKVDCLPLFTYV